MEQGKDYKATNEKGKTVGLFRCISVSDTELVVKCLVRKGKSFTLQRADGECWICEGARIRFWRVSLQPQPPKFPDDNAKEANVANVEVTVGYKDMTKKPKK